MDQESGPGVVLRAGLNLAMQHAEGCAHHEGRVQTGERQQEDVNELAFLCGAETCHRGLLELQDARCQMEVTAASTYFYA